MPPFSGARRTPGDSARRGLGDGLNWLAYLITGMALFGAVGYGLDRWLGTRPVLFVIGTVIGYAIATYGMYLHVKTAAEPRKKRDDEC